MVAPDLLGHGMAPRNDTYKIEDFVANILPRVADRDIDLLIGHSLGGPVSLGLYPHLKNKPGRVVLVDPVRYSPIKAPLGICENCQSLRLNFCTSGRQTLSISVPLE